MAPIQFQSTRLRKARQDDVLLHDSVLQFQSTRLRKARQSHHNSLRDKDFFYEIREPVPPLDSKDAGRVGTMQKVNEINKLLKCEPSRESRTA